jgi:hypothetical protein
LTGFVQAFGRSALRLLLLEDLQEARRLLEGGEARGVQAPVASAAGKVSAAAGRCDRSRGADETSDEEGARPPVLALAVHGTSLRSDLEKTAYAPCVEFRPRSYGNAKSLHRIANDRVVLRIESAKGESMATELRPMTMRDAFVRPRFVRCRPDE